MPAKKNIFNSKASYEEAQELPKERAVRSIINTSVEEGVRSLNNETDLIVLEETLKRENGGKQRRGITSKLESKIKKLRKDQGKLEITVDNNPEVLANDKWQRARDYASAAKRFAKASVACQVMLGFELTALKKELGFTQGRKKAGKRKTENASVFSTWEEHVKAELGFTDRTARNYMNMADAAKRRLKSCFNNLPLLEQPITEYSDEQLELLNKAVSKITDGQTQAEFLIECGIAKKPQGSAAKGGNLKGDNEEEEEEEPTMQQLAFALFASPVHDLCQLRSHSDYDKALSALPITSDEPNEPSLLSIKQHAESLLADVTQALETAKKQTA